jgi:hypothetical protein
MPIPSHPPWLDGSNYTWRRIQVTKLLAELKITIKKCNDSHFCAWRLLVDHHSIRWVTYNFNTCIVAVAVIVNIQKNSFRCKILGSHTAVGLTPRGPLKVNRHFRGTCHLHLQGWRVSQARKQQEVVSMCSCLTYSSTVKMEATRSSETSGDFQRTTWRYTCIPDYGTLQFIPNLQMCLQLTCPILAAHYLSPQTARKCPPAVILLPYFARARTHAHTHTPTTLH